MRKVLEQKSLVHEPWRERQRDIYIYTYMYRYVPLHDVDSKPYASTSFVCWWHLISTNDETSQVGTTNRSVHINVILSEVQAAAPPKYRYIEGTPNAECN